MLTHLVTATTPVHSHGPTALQVSWFYSLILGCYTYVISRKTHLNVLTHPMGQPLTRRVRDGDFKHKLHWFDSSSGYFWNLFCMESPGGLEQPSVSPATDPSAALPWTGMSVFFFQYPHNPVKMSFKNILHDPKPFFQTLDFKGKKKLGNARVSYLNFIHRKWKVTENLVAVIC